MRSLTLLTCWLPLATVAACQGSSERARPGESSEPSVCQRDAACSTGFCDRAGRCLEVDTGRRLGVACQFGPTSPEGIYDGSVYPGCTGLCVEGRCRSCASDSECMPRAGLAVECRQASGQADYGCGYYAGDPSAQAPNFTPRPFADTELGVRVERSLPHASDAFTEGLLVADGWLYESTGRLGASSLRRIELGTGRIDAQVALPPDVFAEGLASVGPRLIQISYQNGRAFVWDRETLTLEREIAYEGEGWGLCYDGQRLIMSDGTDVLQLRDPETFELQGTLPVNLERFVVRPA